ncbi:MAG: DUF4301 family protein [Runella slithyformis]|nr:MAG: DUF4301 family protein [Runella slithyformis]TAF94689.1 MAG: DUF4301 family protein [Runella sp.]TAG16208.1 MAG: DUF4301 family protein [Cytophagales bacterium]TAG35472.1 MAG: DUF4301 family protein [Cytophagia bacterium]TAE98625.1 MAG: DUF4301 family protein [Runella slithyformis]
MFTTQDQNQMANHGIEQAIVEAQVAHFVTGFPYLNVLKAATVGDGIIKINEDDIAQYVQYFDEQSSKISLLKFVPASGAATRMFKSLFAFKDEGKSDKSISEFCAKIRHFAFFDSLKNAMANANEDIDKAIENQNFTLIVDYLLSGRGLDYGSLPKGLLDFHAYAGQPPRTPVEEHLVEGAHYANANGMVGLHFTVSPEHRSRFKDLINRVKAQYELQFGVKYDISFSEQKPSTDTISVNIDNTPFRNNDGTLLFRPAGHGALLANLNDQDGDVVFIKNIDNVVPDHLKEVTHIYKKILAALLLKYRQQIFDFQERIEKGENDEKILEEMDEFYQKNLCTTPHSAFSMLSNLDKLAYFQNKLNRPVRVCGMVKNVGEPGGGPFWAMNADGTVSLQVVESAQIDMENNAQKTLFEQATHFNPVDMFCSLRGYKGKKFDLMQYRDPSTGFISAKSKDGKELKAQELPGLWNGSMADWNTIFVEVPLITFNPVKTANDLLRPEHQ